MVCRMAGNMDELEKATIERTQDMGDKSPKAIRKKYAALHQQSAAINKK
jgi:1,4-dihydroxy-2-naphthoyl-CoA synthase